MLGTPKYQLIEERMRRPLDGQLREWVDLGLTAPKLARLIQRETRVTVAPETVRVWLRLLNGQNGTP